MEHSLFETIAAIARPTNLPLQKPKAFRNYQEAASYLLANSFIIETKNRLIKLWKNGFEDSTMHNMTEGEVIEYANRLHGYKPTADVIPNEQFPNGFESWHETHFEMVKAVLNTLENHLEFGKGGYIIPNIFKEGGIQNVRLFAKMLTDEFETKYNDDPFWVENDFEDTIELFLKDKL